MQDRSVQAIRYKLQKGVRRLNSVGFQQFPFALRQFIQFIESQPLLAGVRDELIVRAKPEKPEESADRIMNGEGLFGTTEVESAALGYECLRRFAAEDAPQQCLSKLSRAYHFGSSKYDEMLDQLREMFLEPFYEYLDEHIDDQQAILYFLRRYKHRCEWFDSDRLRQAVEAGTQHGERSLTFDLYEYLHEQGIDLQIEPRSASGIADFVADQIGEDRVVADAKVFWPEKSKGKLYLISAFHQAYTYARDYNEPCAYLVIFKMCKEDVNFLVPASNSVFPSLSLNNKTVFFVVVDICEHGAPASKRGPLKSIEITAEELIQTIEGASPDAIGDAK